MRKISQILMLSLFLAVMVLSVSCQKDDMESITLKRSGSLTVTILDGETPVTNTKVRFSNEETGNEIDVLMTNESGTIDFGILNEGTYAIDVEVADPYTEIFQEIQVLSGVSLNKTIQIGDYVGTYTVALVDEDNGEIVKEDLGLGVAFVPENDALNKATSAEEVIALATEIKYFGTAGEITLNLPIAYYIVFAVRGDSIVDQFDDFGLDKLEDNFEEYEIDVATEKVFNKVSWSVASVKEDGDVAITDFPISSVRFYSWEGDYRFEMQMKNGVLLSGGFEIGDDGDVDFWSYYSSDPNFGFSIDEISLRFNEQGKLILELDDFDMDDYTGDTDFEGNDLSITLE